MTALNIFQLIVATALPPIAACILYLLEKKEAFCRLGYMFKQVLFGIVFGAIAIMALFAILIWRFIIVVTNAFLYLCDNNLIFYLLSNFYSSILSRTTTDST